MVRHDRRAQRSDRALARASNRRSDARRETAHRDNARMRRRRDGTHVAFARAA